MTLEGLSGDLTPENDYGTSRTTAGAYVSLDPGWGPDDFRTWVISRSCYVQNVATFGYAAIGQKIDGALHNGGNKSIVSNDFTQLISDGIGAWVTNNGRAELVSVFSYYSHVGYLAENGGKIRATNGNNSYGDYGSVAEGVDASETPLTAIVDNRNYQAEVGLANTSGSAAYNFEFKHAGEHYTPQGTVGQVNGSGVNASVVMDETRDGAVFQIRLTDLADSTGENDFGGTGYITAANTAQTGSTTQITIAATDSELSTAYVGMFIYLDGGTGVGQYGLIATYNSGSKIATVTKPSTGSAGWDHMVPGTTIVSPDASTTYTIEPALSFPHPGYAATARTMTSANWIKARYTETYGFYTGLTGTVVGGGSGATFNVIRKGLGYTVIMTAGGTNYTRSSVITILGNSLGGAAGTNDITITVTSINSTTGAVIGYDLAGSGNGGNFYAISETATAAYSSNGSYWTDTTLTTTGFTAIAGGALTADVADGDLITGWAYTIKTAGNSTFTPVGSSSNDVGTTFVATGAGDGSKTGTLTPVRTHLVAVKSGATTSNYSADGGVTWSAGGALNAKSEARRSTSSPRICHARKMVSPVSP
jgi:hypothetical protein